MRLIWKWVHPYDMVFLTAATGFPRARKRAMAGGLCYMNMAEIGALHERLKKSLRP